MNFAYMDNLTLYGSGNLHYLPFGEDWVDQRNSSWNAPYTFTGKIKDAETGYNYFGARYYDSGLSIWLSVDPMSDKYPSMSPYNYCANNPVILVDPDGRDVNISGGAKKEYFEQVKKGAKEYGVKLKMDRNGNLSGKYTGKGPISEEAQQILDAVNDKTVHVKITANWRSEKDEAFGGTFCGNDIRGGVLGAEGFSSTSTYAYQTVIVPDLIVMDEFYNTPYRTSLHEMIEPYIGAKLAERSGISSLETGKNNPYWEQAHNTTLFRQSGPVSVYYFDKNQVRLYNENQRNQIKWIDFHLGDGTNRDTVVKTSKLK